MDKYIQSVLPFYHWADAIYDDFSRRIKHWSHVGLNGSYTRVKSLAAVSYFGVLPIQALVIGSLGVTINYAQQPAVVRVVDLEGTSDMMLALNDTYAIKPVSEVASASAILVSESKEATVEANPRSVIENVSIDAIHDDNVVVEPTVTPTPGKLSITYPATNEEIEGWMVKYGSEYGVSTGMLRGIAFCESGMRPEALSKSGAYRGMFQFSESTWRSNRRAMGLDENPKLRFSGEEAIRTAAFKIGRDGVGAWPVCGPRAVT